MTEDRTPDHGFTVLDGSALVAGAAVALVHLRGTVDPVLIGPASILLWGTFVWVTITAAGPFLFVARRFARRRDGYPRVGDYLWALLGLPWLLMSCVPKSTQEIGTRRDVLYSGGLGTGIVLASIVALSVVWATWVMVPPQQAARTASSPWTNRLGLILAIAWPIQCGVGLVVIG